MSPNAPEVLAFSAGFPHMLLHTGVTIALLLIGAALYAAMTPYRDVQLVREGNTAAAISLGAALVGLAIPLAVAMAASVSVLEIVIWGVAVIVVQLFVFRMTDLVLRGLPKRIQAGEVAAATLLAAVKLATAVVLAAAVAG